jgi:1-acyl-sn-glycerol-3-phosphate acyltransferase
MLSAVGVDLLAAFVLLATVGCWIAYAVRLSRGFRLTPSQKFWYAVNYAITRLLWRARVTGDLPVPPDQGAVVVCNHRSSLDPSFIEITTNRVVRWMVAKEYCNHWALGRFLRMTEVIPVSRGGYDTQATKMAIRYTRNGGIVGIFPEGRINTTDRLLLPGRPGAAMIALKAQVPVVPCYIEGSPYDGTPLGCLLMQARVQVRFGQPMDLSEFYGREDEREILRDITKRLLAAIAALAGQPDFQPEVAGRFSRPERLAEGGLAAGGTRAV